MNNRRSPLTAHSEEWEREREPWWSLSFSQDVHSSSSSSSWPGSKLRTQTQNSFLLLQRSGRRCHLGAELRHNRRLLIRRSLMRRSRRDVTWRRVPLCSTVCSCTRSSCERRHVSHDGRWSREVEGVVSGATWWRYTVLLHLPYSLADLSLSSPSTAPPRGTLFWAPFFLKCWNSQWKQKNVFIFYLIKINSKLTQTS